MLNLTRILFAAALATASAVPGFAQNRPAPRSDAAEFDESEFPDTDRPAAADPQRHAIILVGLPGDGIHQRQFDAIVAQWSSWLVTSLGVPSENLDVLSGSVLSAAPSAIEANAQSVGQRLRQICDELTADDAIWILFLGHANHSSEGAYFHLPGPDLSAEQYGQALESLACREQVVWLTMGSSGWFLKPLSRRGRVVVSATLTDAEPNETEFPQALADVMRQDAHALDGDGDGSITLLEFVSAVVKQVNQRYDNDERAPTEHAQLDDDGNGRGSEIQQILKQEEAVETDPVARIRDGKIARETVLRIAVVKDNALPGAQPSEAGQSETPADETRISQESSSRESGN